MASPPPTTSAWVRATCTVQLRGTCWMTPSHLRASEQRARAVLWPDNLTSSSSAAAEGPYLAAWPQKRREELTPGNVLPLCYKCSGTLPQNSSLAFQSGAVFLISHNLVLLPKDTTAAKPPRVPPFLITNRPQLFMLIRLSRQYMLLLKMLSAQLPEHTTRSDTLLEKKGLCSRIGAWPVPPLLSSTRPGQPGCSNINAPLTGYHPPWAPPAQRQQWILKSHWSFSSSLKTSKLSNERCVVSLQRSMAGCSNNGNDWFVIPGITVLLPGYHLWQLFAARMPDNKCEGSRAAAPGRKGIDYQSLFLPGRVSLQQFILFNGLSTDSLQMASGGSQGNDTRDYKSITIIEPFIW